MDCQRPGTRARERTDKVRNRVIRQMDSTIMAEELVNEMSSPPTLSGTNGWILNCSIGLATARLFQWSLACSAFRLACPRPIVASIPRMKR